MAAKEGTGLLLPKGDIDPGTGVKTVVPERTLTACSLAFVAYVSICGGPFGIEAAVQAAGAFPTVCAAIVLSIFWALPQAIMTAELSTIFSENGGYIVWCFKGLGPYAGWMNAMNSLASNLCDLPIYPVLFSDYVADYYDDSFTTTMLLRGGALALVVVNNIVGMEAVSWVSVVVTLLIVAPFVIEPFFVTPQPKVWSRSTDSIDWSVFVGAVLWNYQGWDSLGCIAGEVKNGKRAYPIGIIIALILITLTYLVPVLVGVSIDPNFENWDDGYLVTVADQIHRWLGIWVLVAAAAAMLGEFNAVMGTSSRALQSMANFGMMPKFISFNHPKFKTPVAAILVQSVVVGIMMFFDFEVLVVADTMFNNVSLFLELYAFLYLKHTKPDIDRPYAVPGRLVGAYACSIPKLIVLVYALYSVGFSWILLAGVSFNILAGALGFIFVRRHASKFAGHAHPPPEVDEFEAVLPPPDELVPAPKHPRSHSGERK